MTHNQIDYWKLQESIRHNRKTEDQTDVANQETYRHNVSYEGETVRHNRATETVSQGSLAETVRHNQAAERVTFGELSEKNRHNVAVEKETTRHNVSDESTKRGELAEKVRHNTEEEAIGYINAGANAGRSPGMAAGAALGLLLDTAKGSTSRAATKANRFSAKAQRAAVGYGNAVTSRLNKISKAFTSVTGEPRRAPKVKNTYVGYDHRTGKRVTKTKR